MIYLTIALSILGFIALNYLVSYLIIYRIVFAKPEHQAKPNLKPEGFSYPQIPAQGRVLASQFLKVSDTAPLIVIFHGQGETIGMWSEAQEWLAKQGCSSFCFDYAGFGESLGWANFATLSRDGKKILASLNEFFPNRKATYLVGFSLGAAILVRSLLEATSKYDGIFLCEPFYSIREMVTDPGRLPKFLKYLIINPLNTGNLLPKISHQVYLLHSQDDSLIPIRHSIELQQKSPHNTILQPLKLFDHNDIWRHPQGGYWDYILEKIKGVQL